MTYGSWRTTFEGRRFKNTRTGLAVALALALIAVLLPLLSSARSNTAQAQQTSASSNPAPGPASIDPALERQFEKDPSGEVEAVVTAWTRGGLDQIEQLGVTGVRLKVLPMILTDSLTRDQLESLSRSAAVRSVFANREERLLMEDTTWLVRARYAWQAADKGGLGVTGEGVELAVIDTGGDGSHEDMDNLIEFCQAAESIASTHETVRCSPFRPESENAGPAGATNTARGDSEDDNGHGTHVSGTMAGTADASGGRDANHSTIGISPDAKLRVYSANAGGSLFLFQIVSSFDDLTFKKINGLNDVMAVNNSYGGGTGANYNPDDPINVAVNRAYDAGILSVFAAGNSGPEHNTLSRQCVNPFVVCVAASTKPDSVVMFSSRGRPSEPADTNRDGVVGGPGDVAPGNHDRELGQRLGLGLYRPTMTAPGVNINSLRANTAAGNLPTCVEGSPVQTNCYVAFNGTSMATPHVAGSVGLIVQAYRDAHGESPTPAIITDILERSANLYKLPGYEAEEQGAGRLDVYAAAQYAKTYPEGLPKPNLGTPSPPYAANQYPGAEATKAGSQKGCTGAFSFVAESDPGTDEQADQPPEETGRFGSHTIDVPEKTERLRITVRWPDHPSANLYARLWRPGVNPDDTAKSGPGRAFPDQEAVGLVFVGTQRFLDVRSPEAGEWRLRVYHRAGGQPLPCDPEATGDGDNGVGYNYNVDVELPQVAVTPAVAITEPAAGATTEGRFVRIAGSASYPERWDGVTNWEVAGSGTPSTGPEGPDTRQVLHFQGNTEEGCTGDGRTDIVACNGPFLLDKKELSDNEPASWKVPNPLSIGTGARNVFDPNWVWTPGAKTTVSGPMTVEWRASCGACSRSIGFSADWNIRLWADGTKVVEQRVTATPAAPNVPEKLTATVNVPETTAEKTFVLHVDPVFIDSQNNTLIYYDSKQPCSPAAAADACDSLVRMPVVTAGGGTSTAPQTPANLRITDVHEGLRVAWDKVDGATSYQIHRSTTPTFAPGADTRIATTPGTACDSPDVPSWPLPSDPTKPNASRSGLCYTDDLVTTLTTYYYRVVAVSDAGSSDASQLAYGTPTLYDRQVKVKVDRLFGPGHWDYAKLSSPTARNWEYMWDTLELAAGARDVFARSFTQGIGSAKSGLSATLPEPEPTPTESPTPEPTDTGSPTPEPTDTGSPTPEPTDTGSPTPEPEERSPRDITLEASKNRVDHNKSFQLSGTIDSRDESAAPQCTQGVEVTIKRDVIGGGNRYRQFAVTTTGEDGSYSVEVDDADRSAGYVASVRRTPRCAAANSDAEYVLVKKVTNMRLSDQTVTRGETVEIFGRLRPCGPPDDPRRDHAGGVIHLQKASNGTFGKVASKRTDDECRVVFKREVNRESVFRLSSSKDDPDHLRDTSGAKVVEVKGRR